MVMQNKALICVLKVLINSQYPSNMQHSNKQVVNRENWTFNESVTYFIIINMFYKKNIVKQFC